MQLPHLLLVFRPQPHLEERALESNTEEEEEEEEEGAQDGASCTRSDLLTRLKMVKGAGATTCQNGGVGGEEERATWSKERKQLTRGQERDLQRVQFSTHVRQLPRPLCPLTIKLL